jgi:hypothetical protein
MRALTLLGAIVAVAGCGKSNEGPSNPAPGPGPGGTPASTVTRNWKEFSSFDHEFKASFPYGDPTIGPAILERIPSLFGDAKSYCADRGEMDKETNKYRVTHRFCIVAAKFKPSATKADREDVVQRLQKVPAIPKGAKKSEPKAVTWSGRPATETAYEGEEIAGQKSRVIVRQLVTDPIVYFGVIQDAGGLTDAEVKLFFESFEIVPRTKPK